MDRCSRCDKPLWEEGVVAYQVRMGHIGDSYDGDPEFFPEEDVGYYCGDCLKKSM